MDTLRLPKYRSNHWILSNLLMNQFHQCPSCNQPWNRESSRPKCPKCNLSLYESLPASPPVRCVFTYVGDYEIWWRSDGSTSFYLNRSAIHHTWFSEETIIPFNITNEQLKLYLTFSWKIIWTTSKPIALDVLSRGKVKQMITPANAGCSSRKFMSPKLSPSK